MDQNRVQRETLYAEVWATPMLTLAPKYGVSAVFLRRVCVRLDIPIPGRGYWAKRQSGQKLKIPPLPKAKLGEPAEWRKGDNLPRPAAIEVVEVAQKRTGSKRAMVIGSLEPFTAGSVASDGYLKPAKRNLPDIIVTELTLRRAASVLVKLATALRTAGHHMSVACGDSGYTRKALEEKEGRLKRSIFETTTWSPGRPTLVFIEGMAIGLTIYEQATEKEMVYLDGRYIPVREAKALKPGLWDRKTKTFYRPTTQRVGSKRLCLRAYSPYWRVEWEHTWVEDNSSLSKQIDDVVSSLCGRAKILAPEVLEAARQVEEERILWEAEKVAAQARYQRSLIVEAREDALQNLLDIINKWSDDRKLREFFEDITTRSTDMDHDERTALLLKVQEAKNLLGSSDSIGSLLAWEAPPPKPPE
ncbi:MAG TPA: hypothetical protein VF671_13395 [Pseudomonas sp.]|uniref:hypothetical protein n=1 Tax=Pseudomonas sp. TaxID=306 RepID=UPI002EDB9DA6